jgi:hypothetical protein
MAGGLLEVLLPLRSQIVVDHAPQGGGVHLYATSFGLEALEEELVELVVVHGFIPFEF